MDMMHWKEHVSTHLEKEQPLSHSPTSSQACEASLLTPSTYHEGNVEKSRQRRSRPFAVLTY